MMKMIVAVVRDEYASALTEQLSRSGFGATKLASTGGFLKAGSSTFLVGVPAEQVNEAMAVLKAACPAKPGPVAASGVTTGSATVFVLNVQSMIKM